MKTLVTIGRGGTGKSSFVALMTKCFIEKGKFPLLLVDADPDQNLAEMVGIDMREAGKSTISELLVETFIQQGGTTVGVPPTQRIEGRIWSNGLFESDNFDFLALGTKWVEGCYCMPNSALKGALESLTKSYQYVLIDSPAGLEHLNRRLTSNVNDIFDVLDHSKKSLDHVRRAYRIAQEVEIKFDNGEKVREHWDGQSRWTRFSYVKKAKVVSAEIDPDHTVQIDRDNFNNSYLVDSNPKPTYKLSTYWLFLTQLASQVLAWWAV